MHLVTNAAPDVRRQIEQWSCATNFTAPLDSERALAVVRILNQMASQYQTAIIVVTHDEKIIPTFKRIYNIRDGKTVEEVGEGREIS